MSYSVCLKCEDMVGGYQKYCIECSQKFNLRNDELFWKNTAWPKDKESEIAKDVIPESELKFHTTENVPVSKFNRAYRRILSKQGKLRKP